MTANALALLYALTMAVVAAFPDRVELHRLAMPLSTLFWGGRAAAFATLVLDQGRWDLWGAVVERLAVLVVLATLHLMAARRIGEAEAVARG